MFPNKNLPTILSLLMVNFIDLMGIVLIFPVLTPLILNPETSILSPTISLAWRDFFYGFILGIFPLLMFFSTPILGDFSDKFGRKKILLICLSLTSVSYIVSAIAIGLHSFFLLIASRAIAGVAAGTQPIATAAIIDLSTPKTKTKLLSWIVFINSIAIIVGPFLGGVTGEKNLVSWFGFETPFLFAALLSLLNVALLFFTLKETPPVDPTRHKVQFTKGFRLFLEAFLQPRFRLLSVIFVSFVLAWSLYFQMINWYFMEIFNYSIFKLGLYFAYIGIIFAFSTLFIVRTVLKIFSSELKAFMFAIVLMIAGNLGAALADSELAQWIWVIPNAIGNAVCYTMALSMFSNSADEKTQGWIMGVASALGAITWAVGGFIAGPLGYMGLHLPFWVASGLCLVCLVLTVLYDLKKSNYS